MNHFAVVFFGDEAKSVEVKMQNYRVGGRRVFAQFVGIFKTDCPIGAVFFFQHLLKCSDLVFEPGAWRCAVEVSCDKKTFFSQKTLGLFFMNWIASCVQKRNRDFTNLRGLKSRR